MRSCGWSPRVQRAVEWASQGQRTSLAAAFLHSQFSALSGGSARRSEAGNPRHATSQLGVWPLCSCSSSLAMAQAAAAGHEGQHAAAYRRVFHCHLPASLAHLQQEEVAVIVFWLTVRQLPTPTAVAEKLKALWHS